MFVTYNQTAGFAPIEWERRNNLAEARCFSQSSTFFALTQQQQQQQQQQQMSKNDFSFKLFSSLLFFLSYEREAFVSNEGGRLGLMRLAMKISVLGMH